MLPNFKRERLKVDVKAARMSVPVDSLGDMELF